MLNREGLLPFGEPSYRPITTRMLEPTDMWMGIYTPGHERIGFVNTTTMPMTRDGNFGTAYTITAKLKLTLLYAPTNLLISGSAWIPHEEGRGEFDFRIRSEEHAMQVTATVEDGVLTGAVKTAGETIPLTLPVDKNWALAGGMGTTALNIPTMAVGEEMVIDTFDPMTLSMTKARVKCTGTETITIGDKAVPVRVVETSMNGIATKAWVDEQEQVVRAETPFGFSLEMTTSEEALKPIEGGDANLIEMVAIRPTGPKPFRGAKRISMRLTGVSADTLPPTDENQSVIADAYVIMVPDVPDAATAAPSAPDEDTLASDALVQANNPKIQETAAEIVGAETDVWRKAERLYTWVYENIEKVPVLSIPSALEVLETRKGDCNEHTVLFTALARAAGVPTRIAIGVVWSNELDGFFYHAWPEVYVGRWIPMDPTLGQLVADATHLKLLNGNIEKWPQLVPYIGQLQIEIVDVE